MIQFFRKEKVLFVCETNYNLNSLDKEKLIWLFGGAEFIQEDKVIGRYTGPRAAMITPWSTNAVEIAQNMSVNGILRIEKFVEDEALESFDPMISQKYDGITQDVFKIDITPETVKPISDIASFNKSEGLALSDEEVTYLDDVATKIGRPLTDSEVFGFSQVNSEHCRHKIFNGIFIIDGEEKEKSLFRMIKDTSKAHPNTIVSAYKDNVAFIEGPEVEQFAPRDADVPSLYDTKKVDSVLSLKAETHNFPTTVEPFNGAATGSGGEIRDRLAGGKGAVPLAGTAVYMTSYSRLAENRPWEKAFEEREWLYQSPMDILIKASNGASDFGNKFGQPLIAGSLLTFEHKEEHKLLGFDKVIMLAGGVGYGKKELALKDTPQKGDKIVILGGDNYRIGMGGAAVSSADTGAFGAGIELNAIQRSNPEMQKRAANTIRALVESENNPIVSIHDHGAGGHLNCLSELVEETGGAIDLDQLPVGDPTLSAKEIIGNESQERMGLVVKEEDIPYLKAVADRERSPMYVVGEVTDDGRFSFHSKAKKETPMDLALEDMFGSSPKTIMADSTSVFHYKKSDYSSDKIHEYLSAVVRLESVGCKDWLTNKVDRCVGGLVAKQQCTGALQLPLNNVGVMSLDYISHQGVATAIGHAPIASLIDSAAGARIAIAESLTNMIWAPLEEGLKSVSLSANWMWPCKNEGEDARLYRAVEAVSDLAIGLGINVPTGKDSLSMAQKYKDNTVLAPGTVIISAGGHCSDIRQIVEPSIKSNEGVLYYIDISGVALALGGSSLAQVHNTIGQRAPDISSSDIIKNVFETIQTLIKADKIKAGHDISSGGFITSIIEMCFSATNIGMELDLSTVASEDDVHLLFHENPGIIIQASTNVETELKEKGIHFHKIGKVIDMPEVRINTGRQNIAIDVAKVRDEWYETSYLLDQKQCANDQASERYNNYKKQPLAFEFPTVFDGEMPNINLGAKPLAAIIREKGSNSEREMANALYRSGFDVRDVHMTDLISGREDLSDIQFLGAVGGFSNSDVLGSAKGWAGSFLYNPKAKSALDGFFAREDTLSIGICNGCQLFLELELLTPEHRIKPKMIHNDSLKHESAFTSVIIQDSNAVMMKGLNGTNLGVWISHGEGKFNMPSPEGAYNIAAKYTYSGYPSNPNGSDYNTAMMCSDDGRHLVTMPHIERSFYPWNWAYYPTERKDDVSPWQIAFRNAYEWLK